MIKWLAKIRRSMLASQAKSELSIRKAQLEHSGDLATVRTLELCINGLDRYIHWYIPTEEREQEILLEAVKALEAGLSQVYESHDPIIGSLNKYMSAILQAQCKAIRIKLSELRP